MFPPPRNNVDHGEQPWAGEVSCDWWRAGHVTSLLTPHWSRCPPPCPLSATPGRGSGVPYQGPSSTRRSRVNIVKNMRNCYDLPLHAAGHNGQACFWFSNGCSHGCPACDGTTRGPGVHNHKVIMMIMIMVMIMMIIMMMISTTRMTPTSAASATRPPCAIAASAPSTLRPSAGPPRTGAQCYLPPQQPH